MKIELYCPTDSWKDFGFNALLEDWFKNLQSELENHIKMFPNDCPWWYNEQATLGFLTNAILRKDNNFKYNVIQEFSCKRMLKKNSTQGRADLFIKTAENGYLLEVKKNILKLKMNIKARITLF